MTEFDANTPIYVQIMHSIRRAIVTGDLPRGEKLPSVREQAETLKVNPNTVQRAYQELEREGTCETRRGMGTFVVESENLVADLRVAMANEVVDACLAGLSALGFDDREILEAIRARQNTSIQGDTDHARHS